ncbi:MAG: glycosyltransferase [Elusimicrobia bacterium]|nr:glycosyltransferase [Elusimicrobiota bacterium]MBD3412622.1 glycosyltransferase [Elusimicrobiota bacterium]
MKILLFSQNIAESGIRGGGSIVWCRSFVRMLRKNGHDVYVFTFGKEIHIVQCEEFKHKVFSFEYKNKWGWIDSIVFGQIPMIIRAAREARTILRAHQIDAIVAAGIHEAAGFFVYPPHVPVFVTCHGIYPLELKMWFTGKRRYARIGAYWLLEQISQKICSGIIYPSNWLKEKLKKRLHAVNNSVIGNCLRQVPIENHAYSKKSLNVREDVPLVVSFNLLIAPYDREEFKIYLETVKKIISIRNDIQFLLIGVSDERKEWVYELIKGLPVTILGYVDNVFEILRLADLFLHVTFTDSFSMITLEAMSVGLPVVVTSEGALPELVEHEKTGLVVPMNPDALSAAVINLLEDKKKRCALGEAAHGYAQAQYNEDRIGKLWDNYLRNNIPENELVPEMGVR